MSKMMIYHALTVGMIAGAVREKVWGVDMLTKTIDPSDEKLVAEHKSSGWHNNPQSVIDEMQKSKLMAEKGALTAEIGLQKQVDDLTAQNTTLRTAFDDEKAVWAVEKAQLTAEVENLNAKVAELTAELEKAKATKPKKAKDDAVNGA